MEAFLCEDSEGFLTTVYRNSTSHASKIYFPEDLHILLPLVLIYL